MSRPSPFRAPDSFVRQLEQILMAALARRRDGLSQPGEPGHAAAVRAGAREQADRLWSEAFAYGGAHAMHLADAVDRQHLGLADWANVLDIRRYGMPDRQHERSEPLPFLMSVITPGEYRPDWCPRCGTEVTGTATVHPMIDAQRSGPADRVLLDPCRHVVKFHDDRSVFERGLDDQPR